MDVLNIEESLIKSVDYSNVNQCSIIQVTLKKIPSLCPHCKLSSIKTNGTQTVRIKHPFLMDRSCTVYLKKYRYICHSCNTTFMSSQFLANQNKSISRFTELQVMELTKDEHLTFSIIAKKLDISVTSAIKIFQNNVSIPMRKLPRILCIDEIYLGKGSKRKYAVVLLDFETNKVIDFINGRRKEDCLRALSQYSRDDRYQVEYLSTDMYQGFIQTAKTMFPKARICIDSFHVISLILKEFDRILKEIMNSFDRDSKEYYLLKNQRFLLLKNESNIKWQQSHYNKKLKYYVSNYRLKELLFNIDSRIKKAYDLKEDYIAFNRIQNVSPNTFDKLINDYKNSGLPPFKSVSRTLEKHYHYILNSFTRINGRRISNGPIESRNSTIKLLIRNASGYRNFDHLRNRVIYVSNNK